MNISATRNPLFITICQERLNILSSVQSKKLRRSIYEIDETMKEKFPDKNTDDSLEKELKYCKQLIDVIKGNEEICSYPKVQEKLKSTRRICH